MRGPSLGEQELEILRFVTEHDGLTVADVTECFGTPRGLARTTVHTMLERLRRKGYLTRTADDGGYRYAAVVEKTELLTGLVGQFFRQTLGGSLKPFAAYLTTADALNADELRELRAVVEALDARAQEDADAR